MKNYAPESVWEGTLSNGFFSGNLVFKDPKKAKLVQTTATPSGRDLLTEIRERVEQRSTRNLDQTPEKSVLRFPPVMC